MLRRHQVEFHWKFPNVFFVYFPVFLCPVFKQNWGHKPSLYTSELENLKKIKTKLLIHIKSYLTMCGSYIFDERQKYHFPHEASYTCIKKGVKPWWRHQMETLFALLALWAGHPSVTCEFPSQRSVTPSFNVIFPLCLNKLLSKQSWGWWFETPSRPYDIIVMFKVMSI